MYINNFLAPVQLGQGVTRLDIDLPAGTYRLTLADSATAAERWEIVDAVVEAGTATLTRGLEGTDDQAWPLGSVMYCALTAGVLNDLLARLAAAESAIHSIPADIAARLLPAGGAVGQALIKTSGADFDVAWGQPVPALTQWALLASGALLRAYTGDGPAVTALELGSGSIQRLAASPDGSLLAVALGDGTTLLLDASGTVTLPLAAEGMSFATPAWHPAGDLLAVERADTHAIQIYSVSGEAISQTISLPEHSGSAWGPSAMGWAGGSFCASAWVGGDATLYVHDEAGVLLATRTASGGGVFLQLVVAGDLLFGVTEGLMRCFDLANGFAAVTPPFFAAQTGVKALAASPDGRYMAVAVGQWLLDSTLHIWDFDVSNWVSIAPVTGEILADQMAWSRDGSRLYVAINGGTAFHLSAGDWAMTSLGVSGTNLQTLQLESAPWS